MKNYKSAGTRLALKKLLNPLFLAMFIFLCAYTVSVIFPIAWGFMTSFKERVDFASRGPLAWPDLSFWDLNKGIPQYENYDHPFGNYTKILFDAEIKTTSAWYKGFIHTERVVKRVTSNMGDYIWNTILYAGVASVLRATGPVICGYLCSRYKYKCSSIIYTYVVIVMITPIVGGTTATLNLTKQLGIFDSWFGLFIRSFGFGSMYFLVFYGFFESASGTYAEAAEIDGASQFRVMVTIYIPLAMTMVGTIVLLNFVAAWNDYNTALMFMPTHLTLAYAIFHFSNTGATENDSVPYRISAVMILAIPVLIVFILLKDKLMGNLSLGGLKE
ncbi:MAG: carbohydrate ABC transporter permease [Clostridia bacterium]|nr:carbohydrate ABC transporter permease [Clostridia bacterium]